MATIEGEEGKWRQEQQLSTYPLSCLQHIIFKNEKVKLKKINHKGANHAKCIQIQQCN